LEQQDAFSQTDYTLNFWFDSRGYYSYSFVNVYDVEEAELEE
jgi:hypothetical protein